MGGRVASPTLVGRIEELQTLEVARGWAANGEPAVVLVGGEAGVGKTRLVAELIGRCTNDGSRVLVAAACRSAMAPYRMPRSWRPCGPLPPMWAWVGSGELVGPSWPELARLLPALGAPERTRPGRAGRPGAPCSS